MTIRLQIIMLGVILIVFILLISLLRKRSLHLKYSLVWLFCLFGVALLCIFPGLLAKISVLLGIETPVYSLFMICIVILTAVCISLTVAVSRLSDRFRILSQNIAIKEKDIIDNSELRSNNQEKMINYMKLCLEKNDARVYEQVPETKESGNNNGIK